MVFFFTCASNPAIVIYMGKDKYENEELIKFAWPDTDVWNCSECSCGGDIDDLEALWRDRRRQAA